MIDAWTSRTPQSTEFPKAETDGVRRLLDVVKQQGIELGEKTSNLFRTAGITIGETLMTFANNVRVEGTLTSTGPAALGGNTTVSGTLTTTGTANINGAMSVGGTMNVTGDATFSGNLAVPNGSITNAALANPVTGASGNAFVGSVTFSTTAGSYAEVTIPVPGGFTRAEVLGVSSLFIGSGSPNAASMKTRINGADGLQMTVTTDQNFANGSSSYARSLSGLSGGAVTVSTIIQQAAGATMSGGCTTSAIVTFYR